MRCTRLGALVCVSIKAHVYFFFSFPFFFYLPRVLGAGYGTYLYNEQLLAKE